MSEEQDGPNLWWQFLEFMGMTWPGKLKKKSEEKPARTGRCQACHNLAKYDSKQDRWYCTNHPSAQINFED